MGLALAVVGALTFWSSYDLFNGKQLLFLLALILLLELLVSPSVACHLPEPLPVCLTAGLAGLSLSAGFMLVSTALLGHVRAMWMEFDNVLPAAAAGLFLGTFCGLPWGIIRRRRR